MNMTFLCKVEICGVDTSKLPVLNSTQMVEMFQMYQNGDKEAREKLIYSNLRLVLSVIQRFSNRNENADDLFQIGCIGLMKAIDNFDLKFEVKFSTYAVPMNIASRGNSKEDTMITRKQALLTALELIDDNAFDDALEVKNKLQEQINALPVIRWSREDIIDVLAQYVQENGKAPSLHTLQRKGFPTKRIVEDRFQKEYHIFLSESYEMLQTVMTRKSALLRAIDYLEQLQDDLLIDAIHVLKCLLESAPVVHWDLGNTLDAIDQFYLEQGRYPFSKDFKGYILPAHGVVKLKFDMYPYEFMEKYYPGSQSVWKRNLSHYEYKSTEEWIDTFRIFMKNNPHVRSKTYDKLRDSELPALHTMLRIAGVSTWNELLSKADLSVKFILETGLRKKD